MLFLRRVGATLGYHKKMGKAYPRWFQEDCVVSGEAVWFQGRRGFRKGCVAVWLQAGWRFQERLGGFRKGCVVSGKAGVFHEKLAGGFRKGVAVSGNGCGKDWVVSQIRQQPFQR